MRKRELRQVLIINFGHNPLRKSSEENQDVVRGSDGGERRRRRRRDPVSLDLLTLLLAPL